MIPLLRQHYPYAVFAALGLLLLFGDPALLIMGMALAIGGLPLAFAPEADEIARGIKRRAEGASSAAGSDGDGGRPAA
jgi:hypothetical protein